MMPSRVCTQIAAQMLPGQGPKSEGDLHPKLREFLVTVDDLCIRAGGELHSRQLIAYMLVRYLVDYPGAPLRADGTV